MRRRGLGLGLCRGFSGSAVDEARETKEVAGSASEEVVRAGQRCNWVGECGGGRG